MTIEIRPVETKRDLKRFIRMPDPIYADDPNWVRPLMFERLAMLERTKNPYFDHAEARYWIAWRDGRPVGRISAQIDRLACERAGRRIGHFGMFESIEDPAVADALFETAEEWLKAKGAEAAQGPYNLSINSECGLLIDGFDTPPAIMMGHARPWYGALVEGAGYAKAKDLIAYDYDITSAPPKVIQYIVDAGHRSPKIRLRPLNFKRYEEEIATVIDIFNDAWSDNWGFVPMTDREVEQMAKEIRPLLHPSRVFFADYEDEPAAMMVTLVDINRLIHDFHGRLLPFNWAKLAWRLFVRPVRDFRVPLMGVRKKYQRSRLGAQLSLMVIEACRRPTVARGGRRGELSWILEDNHGMRKVLDEIGSVPYKTYRIYEKPL
ncbi:MAG: dATP pyrophosphohydrolase [Alphaproteobacteria bacterium]|nr:MAG: dATP pyrophosphohydrolase [Alphaproteobacteria bacterium]